MINISSPHVRPIYIPTFNSLTKRFITCFVLIFSLASPLMTTASDWVPVLPVIPATIGIKNANATTSSSVSSKLAIILPETIPINSRSISQANLLFAAVTGLVLKSIDFPDAENFSISSSAS